MRTVEMEKLEARRFRRAEKIERAQEPDSDGLFGSIRRVLGTALGMLESRVELIVVELREEKKRVFALVCWGVALAFLGFMAAVAIMGIVVFLLWDEALAVLIGFSAFFIVLALASFLAMRSKLKKIPFEETVDQLKKDRTLAAEEMEQDSTAR